MMLKLYFSVLLIYSLMHVDSNQYNIIVIPLPKIGSKNILEYNAAQLNKEDLHRNGNDFFKLDVEDYTEPTEMHNIDTFDFNVDREINYRNDFPKDFDYGDDKIVGGTEVDIDLYPYHVAYGTNCGGAIIDKNWVITAGHCGEKQYVRVGSKYINQGTKINVKRSYIHPMWSAESKEHPFDYDFQLLELSEPIDFDDHAQPVKIANIDDMVIGKVITVTGWGNTEENGPYSNVLRAIRVPIISKEKCQNVPFPYFRGSLTPRMFCAGYPEGKKDACQGDSGGPAVSNERLLGMVSFGYGCATPGSYGVYSKVAKIRGWIEITSGLTLE